MLVNDRLYGKTEINEPVLLDLFDSAAVQRLHGVLQHGISGLIGLTRATTRFEHSLGVLLLVRLLGAGLEEQIAALLHDVSHTAFSHVIDYVFDGHDSQSFHDEHKGEYAAGTDLPQVLEKHGYDWCDFICLDEKQASERYPLLEQPSPALCADRLDYFLRDAHDLGFASLELTGRVLRHLRVVDGRMVLQDVGTARWTALTFMAADQASWANFREVGLYELAAMAIRRALELGVLSRQDLWGTDKPTWGKLADSRDPEIQRLVRLVHLDTRFTWDEQNPSFRISTKLRTIDPPVLVGGKVQPLSQLDPAYERQRREYLSRAAGKWPMRVIPAG